MDNACMRFSPTMEPLLTATYVACAGNVDYTNFTFIIFHTQVRKFLCMYIQHTCLHVLCEVCTSVYVIISGHTLPPTQ